MSQSPSRPVAGTARPSPLLALDACGAACAVAVLVEGEPAVRRVELMERGQSERLVPLIAEALGEGGLEASDLAAIATTVGPGGFTGVRIGLATARGLALATGRPALGLTCFAVAAAACKGDETDDLLVAIESKRRELYVQRFDRFGRSASEPAAVPPEDLAAWLGLARARVTGDAAGRAVEALEGAGVTARLAAGAGPLDPVALGRLAYLRAGTGDALSLEPLYLRPPDVSRPKPGRIPAR